MTTHSPTPVTETVSESLSVQTPPSSIREYCLELLVASVVMLRSTEKLLPAHVYVGASEGEATPTAPLVVFVAAEGRAYAVPENIATNMDIDNAATANRAMNLFDRSTAHLQLICLSA